MGCPWLPQILRSHSPCAVLGYPGRQCILCVDNGFNFPVLYRLVLLSHNTLLSLYQIMGKLSTIKWGIRPARSAVFPTLPAQKNGAFHKPRFDVLLLPTAYPITSLPRPFSLA